MDGPAPPPLPPDLARTPVAVLPDTYARGVQAPGTPPTNPSHCTGPDCPHTYDWREPPGSPGNTHGTTAGAGGLDLREALETVYPFDAMLLGYVVCDATGTPLDMQPRATKQGLAWLESQGFRVMLTTFLADLDNPGHGDWTPELRADYEAKRAALPELATAGDYITLHGARIVQPIWPWLPVQVGEIALKAWLERLRVGGLPDSSDTSDWTRCMRLPRALRPLEDGTAVQLDCELRIDTMVPIAVSRIVPGAASPPSVLEGRILGALGSKGAPARAVTGPDLARFADNLCRRTGGKETGAALKLVLQGLPWAPRGARHLALFKLARDLVREFWPCDLESLAARFDLAVDACRADCGSAWNSSPARLPIAHLRAAVAAIETEREARAILKAAGFARGDTPELAARLAEDLRDGSPVSLVYDRGAVHRYAPERGVYERLTDAVIDRTTGAYAGRQVGGESEKPHPLNLSRGAIVGAREQLPCTVGESPGFFDGAEPGLACANGFVALRDGRAVLVPHHPDQRALDALPWAWTDPPAPTPLWDALCARNLALETPEETGRAVGSWEEFLGASLAGRATRYQKALVLKGPQGTGKSTLLKIAERLFPPGAVCAIRPHDLGTEFLAVRLVGARINIRAELPFADVEETDTFNSAITGDAITVQEKHRPSYRFRPVAGHLYSCNHLPGTRDRSGAFTVRFLVLLCEHTVRGTKDQIRDLEDRIIAEELPGVFARCLAAFARLVQRDRYDIPEASARQSVEWDQTSNPLAQWLAECTAPDATARTPARALYGRYRAWCQDAGHRPLSLTAWGITLGDVAVRHRTPAGTAYELVLRAAPGAPVVPVRVN